MKVCNKVMIFQCPLCINPRLRVNVACLGKPKVNNREMAPTHTIAGSIRDGDSTSHLMVVSQAIHTLVLTSRAIVTGRRPRGVVITADLVDFGRLYKLV